MKKILYVLVLVILSFLLHKFCVYRETYVKAEDNITHFSELYGSNEDIVRAVIRCESHGLHSAKGDGGNANGIAQFWEGTFNRMSNKLGEKLDYNSEYDQVKLLSFAMSKPELAREWTSYRAIMNGGKYTFYSKVDKKIHTVYCKL